MGRTATEPRTWIEVSRAAVSSNYRAFRKAIGPEVLLLGVVKSNAYGHELIGFSRELSSLGVDWLGVDSITEALALRRAGIKTRILVQGYTLPQNHPLAAQQSVSVALSTWENLKSLARLRRGTLSVHLKVDTGMHRHGFLLPELPQVLRQLKKTRRATVEGLFTHFAGAKSETHSSYTQRQLAEFKEAIALTKRAGFTPLCHAAATASVLSDPNAHFDMVRVGIGLYGLWPSDAVKAAKRQALSLCPAMTWKTVIAELKTVEKGERIGYDYSERLRRRTRVALLPIGYWHGYWRAFSGKAHVLVKGRRARVLGRVSMDITAVDVTDVPRVSAHDEVVLLGQQGKGAVPAEELAKLARTSAYEIVTRTNPLIKKYFT